MGMNRGQIDRGGNYVCAAQAGDSAMEQTQLVAITTVGTGVLSAAGMLAGLIVRTGPVGAYADTLDTANNLMLAAPFLSPGDAFEFVVQNGVAEANTVAVAEGAELVGTTAIAASLVRRYLLTVFANRTRQTFNAVTTNANAVLTGLTQAECDLLQPGQGVSGTGISSGTNVLSVNSVLGTVTLTANATATSAPTAAITFFPRYSVRGLFSATA